MHKKLIEVHCPVDFEVYDANSRLVGKIIDNEVVEGSIKGIAISVDGDQKNVVLPSDKKYTLKLTATDNETMNYTVKSIAPMSCQALETKAFANVSLTSGKLMTSAVGDVATNEVQLLVTDSAGNPIASVNSDGTETAISNKQYFKLWGKITRWEKKPLNWILLSSASAGFGWR